MEDTSSDSMEWRLLKHQGSRKRAHVAYSRDVMWELIREAGGASSDRKGSPREKAELDIHFDENVMKFMTTNLMQEDWNRRERRRIHMRIQSGYHLDEGRVCNDGLIVPKRGERTEIVQHVHEELGHVGRERTLAAVMQNYY